MLFTILLTVYTHCLAALAANIAAFATDERTSAKERAIGINHPRMLLAVLIPVSCNPHTLSLASQTIFTDLKRASASESARRIGVRYGFRFKSVAHGWCEEAAKPNSVRTKPYETGNAGREPSDLVRRKI